MHADGSSEPDRNLPARVASLCCGFVAHNEFDNASEFGLIVRPLVIPMLKEKEFGFDDGFKKPLSFPTEVRTVISTIKPGRLASVEEFGPLNLRLDLPREVCCSFGPFPRENEDVVEFDLHTELSRSGKGKDRDGGACGELAR